MAAEINRIYTVTDSAETFGGIDRSNGTPLGYWDKLCNMDMSAYPSVCTCAPFSYKELDEGITGYTFFGGEIVYTKADGLYISGEKTALSFSEGEKTLVVMGAQIVIFPDYIIVNTATEPYTVTSPVRERLTGRLYEYNQNQTRPTVSVYKLLYLDVAEDDSALSDYAVGDQVRLVWSYGGKERELTVCISSVAKETYSASGCVSVNFDTSALSNTRYFYTEGRKMDRFRVPNIEGAYIEKPLPELDFVVQHNNRLWGCSSKRHEIYCSKLGSALEWGKYDGISTDSWTATVGSEGDFTGACVYANSVLFFKENCVHVIYGTKASNFTISTIALRGVQKGSFGSLCESGGLLYYKAPEGIFSFNGSSSSRIDAKLDTDITDTAVACADGRYIIMLAKSGTAYYYDKRYGQWYTRLLNNAVSAHEINGRLYAVTKTDGKMRLVRLIGTEDGWDSFEGSDFLAVSGTLGRSAFYGIYKKLKLSLSRLKGDADTLKTGAYISCDNGEWKCIYESTDGNDELACGVTIPIRCRSVRIKICGELSGKAKLTLHGIYLDREKGSELSGKY